jgi:cyclic pyranopterin phosphate synthase
MVDRSEQLERFRIFNEKGGKFRVAIINTCNLDCFFCHNEGMSNPRRGQVTTTTTMAGARHLGKDDIVRLINAFTRLGGRQVNITGGEPLAHPEVVPILEAIDKRQTRVVLNTNALLAHKLVAHPRVQNLDAIFASLHTTDDEVFRSELGGTARSVAKVKHGIVSLKKAGYEVQINYSLGPYNVAGFAEVLDFAIDNEIDLKAIALVRSSDAASAREFYGGDWIDPRWLSEIVLARSAVLVGEDEGLGGHTTTYRIGRSTVKVKNVARGRLETDLCRGCLKRPQCGEGIYGFRVGVDGVMKPCLLRRDKDRPLRESSTGERCESYEDQILDVVSAMIGDFGRARFVGGAPA